MTDIRLPSEVRKLLKAAKVKNIDMYAGRRVRNGAGKVHYQASRNGNGGDVEDTITVSPKGPAKRLKKRAVQKAGTSGESSNRS